MANQQKKWGAKRRVINPEIVKKRKKEPEPINLFDLIPTQNIGWVKNEEGLTILFKPKFQNPFLKRYILSRLKRPFFKIKLDDVGSYVWELCNGKRTVKEIALGLSDKFGENVEPLYDRLTSFLQNLEKNHFIYYRKKEDKQEPKKKSD